MASCDLRVVQNRVGNEWLIRMHVCMYVQFRRTPANILQSLSNGMAVPLQSIAVVSLYLSVLGEGKICEETHFYLTHHNNADCLSE